MIASALLATCAIAVLLAFDAEKRRSNELSAEGVALVRLLGSFEWDDLAPVNGRASVLETLRARLGRSAFVYAAIFDNSNVLHAYVGNVEEIPGLATQPVNNWLDEREIELGDGRTVLEFSAPVTRTDALAGSLRLGFVKPGHSIRFADIPSLAQFALPIFMLVPIFYFLMRREMRPLQDSSRRLDEVVARGELSNDGAVLQPSADLQTFIANFNRYIDAADARSSQDKIRNQDLLVHQRLVSYEKGRIEAALQTLPLGLLVIDESGAANFANDNLAVLLGLSTGEIKDRPPGEWEIDDSLKSFISRLNGGRNLHRVEELEFNPESNPQRSIAVSAFPLLAANSATENAGVVVVFEDETADAMARNARDEFVAHVAHELKSPLNVINMQAETLAEFGAEDAEIRVSSINIIQDEIDRLARLIKNLLSITQIESGSVAIDRQPIKSLQLFEDAFEAVTRGVEARDIKTKLDLPRSLPNLIGDKDLLRLALNNLLTNAIKYSRDGGFVTLSAEENDDMVIVKVSDEGLGIDPQDQQHIFEKFFRSAQADARAREGHGLGLALTKQVIDMHQGSISVESELGQGTTFTMALHREVSMLQEAV